MSQLAEPWDVPVRNSRERKPSTNDSPASPATVEGAIKAWLRARAYSPSTSTAALHHLCGSRATGWREREGITTMDQLTAAKAAEYLIYLRDRGAAPATIRKVKMLFMSLRTFCKETPGLEAALKGKEMAKLRLPAMVQRIPQALTENECVRLIEACKDSERDRLIVETLLLTGLRVSELCSLTLDALQLDQRPAYLEVRGSVHNPERTKNARERRVIIDYDRYGFGRGYVQRLRRYIDERPSTHNSELFLTKHQPYPEAPVTTNAVKLLMKRLETATGIHCNPHKFRHTFATRCVDQGVPMFNLQEALGHSSLEMVRRYYTYSSHAQAEAFYRAFSTTRTWH